jgi:hypothetical protein
VTAEEVIVAAMARCTDLGATVPSAWSVYLRRIGLRQGQIFSMVAQVDPEYFGVESFVPLVNGAFTLANLSPKVERIADVRIGNPGSSGFQSNDPVNLIRHDDQEAMLPPRAVVRDQILRQVGNDLQGVSTLVLYYSKRPATSSAITKATVMELPEQFQDLLVIDLAKQMIRKLLDVEPARRDGWLGLLSDEESMLLGVLESHVRGFVAGEQVRFRPPSAPPKASDRG